MVPISMRSLLAVLLICSTVIGHPGAAVLTRSEKVKREMEAQHRLSAARTCFPVIESFTQQRKYKRALRKRELQGHGDVLHPIVASPTGTAYGPHVSTIPDATVLTAPEIEEGPYYVNNEYVRQDVREDQLGVTMVLDIGVIDTVTCKPLANAFVEIWGANATGFYGSFEKGGFIPGPPPPGKDAPSLASPQMSSQNTYLRGGYPTNDEGIVELITLFPGFYQGRTIHTHVMVHTNWSKSENGTILSHTGNLVHTGQLFTEESWNDKVTTTQHYMTNTNKRTYNLEDHDYLIANSGKNNANIAMELLTNNVNDGVLGYITIGVNASAVYEIGSTNYYQKAT